MSGARAVTRPVDARGVGMDEWVPRLAQGDTAAFADVVDALHRPLFAYAVRLVADPEVAEEVVQDAFVALVRRMDRLRSDDHLRAFLYVVVRNRARSHHRWARVEARRLLAWGMRWLRGPDDPAEVAVAGDVAAAAVAALAAMPFAEREVAALAWGEGLVPAEIAARLGLGDDVVRQRLARARKRFRSAEEEP